MLMRLKKNRLSTGLTAAITMALLFGTLIDSGTSRAAVTTTPDFFNDAAANYAAALMGQHILTDLPANPNFAGARIVPSGIEIDIVGAQQQSMLTTVTADTETFLGQPIPITYRTVARTQRFLDAIGTRITADQPWWLSQDVSLTSWGIDLDSNTVLIKLAKYSDRAALLLKSRYGDGVSVYPADFLVKASDRTNDTVPWYGGDDLFVAGARCTSWFSLVSTATGIVYNATAGHCGPGNVYVRQTMLMQGDVDPAYQRWTNGGNADAELYPVTSNAGRVWADPMTGTRLVTSRATQDMPGTLLCTDGAVDREVCSVRIINTVPVSYNGKTINNQVYAEQVNDKPAFSAGDSGGPVYAGKNGSAEAQAFGMVVAATTDPAHGFYTPARYIFAEFPNATFQPTK